MIDTRSEKRRFQIRRDDRVGVSMYERESGREALLDFFADRARGEVRTLVEVGEDGVASVTVDGVTYVARELA